MYTYEFWNIVERNSKDFSNFSKEDVTKFVKVFFKAGKTKKSVGVN
jgi:hypothetical protein